MLKFIPDTWVALKTCSGIHVPYGSAFLNRNNQTDNSLKEKFKILGYYSKDNTVLLLTPNSTIELPIDKIDCERYNLPAKYLDLLAWSVPVSLMKESFQLCDCGRYFEHLSPTADKLFKCWECSTL